MSVSLPALRTFEVAARHQSFKAAAAALNLSPTAVSHHIRNLEAALGTALFLRSVRRVVLTPEGEELARSLRPAFATIDEALARFTRRDDRETVTLGAGPLFAARWLAGRLGDFWSKHPGIDLRIHHSPLPVVEQMDRFDLAVAWGEGPWAGLGAEILMQVSLSPVHAPGVSCALADLGDATLLHQRSREAWRSWLRAAHLDPALAERGPLFDDTNVMLQAALDGQGMALGIFPLIDEEVASGRLLRPWQTAVTPREAYTLVHREEVLIRPAVAALRTWLLAQAKSAGEPAHDHRAESREQVSPPDRDLF